MATRAVTPTVIVLAPTRELAYRFTMSAKFCPAVGVADGAARAPLRAYQLLGHA